MLIEIPEVTGRCRWCGCTLQSPCPEICTWVNTVQTLCTSCVDLDRLVQTAPGRLHLTAQLRAGELAMRAQAAAGPRSGRFRPPRRRKVKP